MPYHVVVKHPACPMDKPDAVVENAGGKVMGCHPDMKAANKQMDALHASEMDASIRRMTGR